MADDTNIQSYFEAIIDAKNTGVLESMFKKLDTQSQQINQLQTTTLNYESRIASLEAQNIDLINRILDLEEYVETHS